MSKSLGNVIDPIEMIDLHGADALRFSLARLATGGQQDIPLSVDSIKGGRNFANKIWNAARLVLQEFPGGEPELPPEERLTAPQRWLLVAPPTVRGRGERVARRVRVRAGRAGACIDSSGPSSATGASRWRRSGSGRRTRPCATDAANVLAWILERTLRLLHPVMPFVTEEIWQRFGVGETIMRAPWPEADECAGP